MLEKTPQAQTAKKYNELCPTKDLPFSCVYPQCLRDKKQFEEYLEKF
jgi:hypothetical protein